MKNETIQMLKIALASFIEELIQSENGIGEDDAKYIAAEQERIRQMQLA